MKITKLTTQEITDLQPTEVSYAADTGEVLGGIEASEWDESYNFAPDVARAAKRYFGASAAIYGEGCDGDGCIHWVVIREAIK